MWDGLSELWRACAEEAWEAYRRGSLPIGAVVTDSRGDVLSRGRNRIHERSGPPGAVFGNKLAHAELNALLSLDHREHDPRACVLWTTTEPCPLCAGAARMADVGGLRYAAREPWGGSAAMFGTVPYLKRGGVRVVGPEDGLLEGVLVALQVERFLSLRPEILERFLRLYGEVMSEVTEAGRSTTSPAATCCATRGSSSATRLKDRTPPHVDYTRVILLVGSLQTTMTRVRLSW